ncbi:hypothetical protein OPV22_031763 [Ensete ventricosum]|uniref:Uncharacterized protein n=1 Tax=Ensete ventricosum TaxID=4639 RepID=A0AAV8PLG3_ENSVE|nr:hypothetical protein OPV22_031763 [Ensete ventricosum]
MVFFVPKLARGANKYSSSPVGSQAAPFRLPLSLSLSPRLRGRRSTSTPEIAGGRRSPKDRLKGRSDLLFVALVAGNPRKKSRY